MTTDDGADLGTVPVPVAVLREIHLWLASAATIMHTEVGAGLARLYREHAETVRRLLPEDPDE